MKKTVLFSAVCLCLVLAAANCQAEILVDQIAPVPTSVASVSHIGGQEVASRFNVRSCVTLQKITWAGLIKKNEEGLYPFAIRLYDSKKRRPARMDFVEFKGDAKIVNPASPTLFTLTFDEEYYLPAGNYWISILYAGPSEDLFAIAVESGRHGGAGRRTNDAFWRAPWFLPPYLCNGYSIRIEGETMANAECQAFDAEKELIQ
jgi:hypothetical protein